MPEPAPQVDVDLAAAHVAKAERDCWIVPDVPPDTPTVEVRKIGIIGAGTMGGGIAMNFANVGLPVTIVETQQAALDRGLGVVKRNYDISASRGRFTSEEADARFGRLKGTLSLEDLGDCDLIIEAVFEDMALKKSIFERLDRVARPGAVLASNTSGLNLDEIASATRRPDAVVGMHFFSPANVMRLLEVVRGEKTAKEVIATALAVARKIDKIAVVVGVAPGFVGNRMLYYRQQQANRLILEGPMPWDVDRVLRQFGFRMGPFEMSDLAGLDIGWKAETSRGETLRDVLCEQGRRGQKTGAGFYDYGGERTGRPSPVVEGIIADFAARRGLKRRKISDEEILERLLYPMINEAAVILEQKKAIRASDIDVVWLHGYRWPAETGGPMFWADQVGLPRIVEALDRFAADQDAAHLRPSPLLMRLAESGGSFTAK